MSIQLSTTEAVSSSKWFIVLKVLTIKVVILTTFFASVEFAFFDYWVQSSTPSIKLSLFTRMKNDALWMCGLD